MKSWRLSTLASSVIALCVLQGFVDVPPPTAQQSPEQGVLAVTHLDGVTITFSPHDWTTSTVVRSEKEYTLLSFRYAQLVGKPGQPQLPARAFLVGIPLDAEVTARVLDAPFQELEVGQILPTPRLGRDEEGLPKEEFVPDSLIYGRPEAWPESPVLVGSPGMVRQQRVVKVTFIPVQYLPSTQRIRRYERISVRLTWSRRERGPDSPVVSSPREEDFYRELLVNYEQCRPWRVRRVAHEAGLRKPAESGPWYKIVVQEEGLYRLDGARLAAAGVNLASIDPKTLRLYNNGGLELPQPLGAPRPDSLIENPILVYDGGDNRFDSNDYLIFYGKSVRGWTFDPGSLTWKHYVNRYTSENVYWLTWGQNVTGKRVPAVPSASPLEAHEVTSFTDHAFFEQDITNPFGSGLLWFGALFTHGDTRTFRIELPNALPEDSARYVFNVVAASVGQHLFTFSVNGNVLGSVDLANYAKDVLRIGKWETSAVGKLASGNNAIAVRLTGSSALAQGYLDWFEVHYRRAPVAVNDQLLLYAPPGQGLQRFTVRGFSQSDVLVLDVSDFWRIRRIEPLSVSSGVVTFVDSARVPDGRRYLLCASSAFRTPVSIRADAVSNLRDRQNGADLVIIAPDDFYDQAMQLKSLRENWNSSARMSTQVVRISDVYDEFSWGLVDPTAIRDFLRYAYERWSQAPTHVLLFGDGDYDYRNVLSQADANWVPPYESGHTDKTASITSDDWFTYISGTDEQPDMAIGRLPARSPAEAQQMVNKIVAYETMPHHGDWRNAVTMVGDDELVLGGAGTELIHTQQAETLAEEAIPKSFDVNKVYLVEYPAVRSPAISGVVKPAANQALLDQINKGSLIINFVGHGNPQLWTHERVLNLPVDFPKIQNGEKYGLWIAATCSFGRFDDPYEQSMAEELVTVEGRGAIAVVAAARDAWSHQNADLNRRFLVKLFAEYATRGQVRTLGEALWLAKLMTASAENEDRYLILGDPSLRIGAPRYQAVIESLQPDSLAALAVTTVTGRVFRNGAPWDDFTGLALVKVFDTRRPRSYSASGGGTINYVLPGNVLFRGQAKVEQGRFAIKFIVPKDISYGGTDARVSVYFWGHQGDGAGFRSGLRVGGTGAQVADSQGPHITIGFRDRLFASGEYVGPNPTVRVQISDSLSGVNIAGDVGHKITMVLDGREEERKDLTEFFNYDQDSYTSGSIEYQLFDLAEGPHSVEIKAWDNSNNSSVATATFTVVAERELKLSEVVNFPNPFRDRTDFTFLVSREADVTISIYTLAGRMVKKLRLHAVSNFNAVPWDGRDEDGDELANGLYLYRIVARAQGSDGPVSAEAIGKLVIAR
ncbi:MAG: type IX secretion system sortase PorU [candidate division KSB1 bacterium]|nr:type IX secretion system sortase PorU [candidate division KSB1 bacterium]